jgi:hypothetical protein
MYRLAAVLSDFSMLFCSRRITQKNFLWMCEYDLPLVRNSEKDFRFSSILKGKMLSFVPELAGGLDFLVLICVP